jgi:hypothetical protein
MEGVHFGICTFLWGVIGVIFGGLQFLPLGINLGETLLILLPQHVLLVLLGPQPNLPI